MVLETEVVGRAPVDVAGARGGAGRGPGGADARRDGWRWTLSLLIPNVLLWWERPRLEGVPGAPFTLDMLALNRAQRDSCRAEYYATQGDYLTEGTAPSEADRAQHVALGALMADLGGGHTIDTVPDDVTPYRTEDGGWSTKALDDYLRGQP